jgi:hypothetical protein
MIKRVSSMISSLNLFGRFFIKRTESPDSFRRFLQSFKANKHMKYQLRLVCTPINHTSPSQKTRIHRHKVNSRAVSRWRWRLQQEVQTPSSYMKWNWKTAQSSSKLNDILIWFTKLNAQFKSFLIMWEEIAKKNPVNMTGIGSVMEWVFETGISIG